MASKKTIEMDLEVTFTQSVEVEVDEEMIPLIEDYLFRKVNILTCCKNPEEKKIIQFLGGHIDYDRADEIKAEIELFNEV